MPRKKEDGAHGLRIGSARRKGEENSMVYTFSATF